MGDQEGETGASVDVVMRWYEDRVVVLGSFEGRARDAGRIWTTAFAHALTVSDGRVERLEAYFDTAAAVDAHSAPAGERS